MKKRLSRLAYKEVRLQQLRSFCETARLGSFSAAANSLGLAQPTVWEQVHALERAFDVKLIDTHERGCRVTEAGRILVGLAATLVTGVESLKDAFVAAMDSSRVELSIAATQRQLVEDLPAALERFRSKFPRIRLHLIETSAPDVAAAVESKAADLGFVVATSLSNLSPWLHAEIGYELESYLIAPKNHPLSRRRSLRLKDLSGYPFVNRIPEGFADQAVVNELKKQDDFRNQDQLLVARQTAVVRRYVEMGFGIGIVPGLPKRKSSSRLHERSLGSMFGRLPVHLVWRKGSKLQASLQELVKLIRAVLGNQG